MKEITTKELIEKIFKEFDKKFCRKDLSPKKRGYMDRRFLEDTVTGKEVKSFLKTKLEEARQEGRKEVLDNLELFDEKFLSNYYMSKIYKKNPQVRFEVKIGKDSGKKLDAFLKKHNITKREFLEIAIISLLEQDNYTNGQFPKDK